MDIYTSGFTDHVVQSALVLWGQPDRGRQAGARDADELGQGDAQGQPQQFSDRLS